MFIYWIYILRIVNGWTTCGALIRIVERSWVSSHCPPPPPPPHTHTHLRGFFRWLTWAWYISHITALALASDICVEISNVVIWNCNMVLAVYLDSPSYSEVLGEHCWLTSSHLSSLVATAIIQLLLSVFELLSLPIKRLTEPQGKKLSSFWSCHL